MSHHASVTAIAGCEVWGAAHTRHAALLRTLGATHVDSDQADFTKVLPEGFDVVFDGIAEDGFTRAWRAVGAKGHLSAYGFSAGVKSDAPLLLVGLWFAKLWWWNTFSGQRSAKFVSITTLRKQNPEWFVADLGTLLDLLARGDIQPRVAERIDLDGVADAHERLEQ